MPKVIVQDNQASPELKEVKKPHSILSPAMKKNIFNQLKNIPDDLLLNALKIAFKGQIKFSEPLHAFVVDFYVLLNKHGKNQKMLQKISNLFDVYIGEDGLNSFKEILQSEFVEANWPSEFLCNLASTLKIKLNIEPHVQVAIKEGKILWRIMKGEQEVFNKFKKEGQEVDFTRLNIWNMTWQQFRLFKDSGKRSSNISITLERFTNCFEEPFYSQAEKIWNELKEMKILNEQDKLSDAWRAISGQNISLKNVDGETPDIIITVDKLKACLKSLAGTKKTKIISKEGFKNWWPADLQLRAGLIWDKLKAAGHLTAQNKLKTFVLSYKELIVGINLSYKQVVEALYAVANDEQNKVHIKEMPDGSAFRPERTIKNWSETGRVTNSESEDVNYCTKLWDVSIYEDLGSHRNSEDETQQNNDQKLNYDHIPSADSLKAKASSIIKEKEKQIAEYKEKIEKNEVNIAELEADVDQDVDDQNEENEDEDDQNLIEQDEEEQDEEEQDEEEQDEEEQDQDEEKQDQDEDEEEQDQDQDQDEEEHDEEQPEQDKEILALQKKIEKLKKQQSEVELTKKQISSEIKNHGKIWWTIAIPEKLHKQGETFLQSSKDQGKTTDNHFLKDVVPYLDILEKRPEDFSLNQDDYLKALGAFRYLYKKNATKPQNIVGQYSIGAVPHTLFHAKNKQAIDKVLTERTIKYLQNREGIKIKDENEVVNNIKPTAKGG